MSNIMTTPMSVDLHHPKTGNVHTLGYDGEHLYINQEQFAPLGYAVIKRAILETTMPSHDKTVDLDDIREYGRFDARTIKRSAEELSDQLKPIVAYEPWTAIMNQSSAKTRRQLLGIRLSTRDNDGQNIVQTSTMEGMRLLQPHKDTVSRWVEQVAAQNNKDMTYLLQSMIGIDSSVLHGIIVVGGSNGLTINDMVELLNKESDQESNVTRGQVITSLTRIAQVCSHNKKLSERFKVMHPKGKSPEETARFVWKPKKPNISATPESLSSFRTLNY